MVPRLVARISRGSFLLLSAGASCAAGAAESSLVSSADGHAFSAAGRLHAALDCTGSVVAGSTEPDASRPALVLTAAHCVIPDAYADSAPAVVRDQVAAAGWTFTPSYFHDSVTHQPATVGRVLYATLKGSDIAVVQLSATYGELRAQGVVPLTLDASDTPGVVPVDLLHVPLEGVGAGEQFLRHSRCQAYEQVRVMEGARFLDKQSRTDCAGVARGSSGGAVVRAGTGEITGVMVSQVDPRFEGCGFDRPCELAGREPVSREGATYLSRVAWLAPALGADGNWNDEGLDRAEGVVLDRTMPQYTRRLVDDEGELTPATWGVVIASRMRWIRYKQGDAATVDCSDASGYSQPLFANEQPLDRLPLPQADGAYLACVIGEKGIDNDWQSPAHATTMLRIIDDTPPTRGPTVSLIDEDDTGWTLAIGGFHATNYQIARRPHATGDCNDPAGYRPLASSFVKLPKAKGSFRLCVKGQDEAGNVSPAGMLDLAVNPLD